jgi:4-hydroxybenzoate polyprenyltransferase
MKKYIKIMRIDHWIKQFFILPGFVCALYLGKYNLTLNIIIKLIIGLLATSLIASANYVINEYLDAEFDKFHPIKSKRPLVEESVKGYIIWLLWLFLSLIGLLIGYFTIGKNFFLMELFLLIMGILYNVKPFRTKDVFLLDVLSESINNAIRFMLGWFITPINIIVPISIILGYWMGGAFLMGTKRYAEYRIINNKNTAALYRKSFKYYNEKTLLTSSFFYAMCSVFFIGIFLIKYRIELILSIPFIIGLFCYYFYISFANDSVVQKPEKLYKEKGLMLYCIFLVILITILMNFRIPWLDIFVK